MKWLLNHRVHGNTPWAVQVEAMKRSSGRSKYAYFLEMGLGKTALTFNDFLSNNDVDLLLVIAPNSFKLDWTFVPEAWGRPDIQSGAWPKTPLPFKWETGVYALNYECARSNVHTELYKLLESRKCMLVIDEATAIKNPGTDIAKGVLQMAKRAAAVRLLNGTPLGQNIVDYFQQLRCVGEFNGWVPLTFRNRYARFGGYMGKQIVGVREDTQEELAKVLDRASFRALKVDWRKDLPPQIVVDPIHVEMTNKQRRHYKEMMDDFYTQVAGVEVTASMVLTQYDKLRQISSCMAIDGDRYELIEKPENNPKMQATFELHEGGNGKTVIVYWYKSSGIQLFEEATRRKLNPAILKGRMKPEDLVTEKRRFNEDPSCRVIITQEDAGCRGHDLLGDVGNDRCNSMVFYENSFSYWQRVQMQDRNHRGVQDQQCNIYDVVTSPMDEFAIEVIRKKRDLAQSMDDVVQLVRSRRWL